MTDKWIHWKAMPCRQIRLSSSSSSPFTCFLASLLFFLFLLPLSPSSSYFSSLLFLQQTNIEDLLHGKHYPRWGGLNGSINCNPCPQGNKHRNRSMTIGLWYSKHFGCKQLRRERGISIEKLTFVLALQRWTGVQPIQFSHSVVSNSLRPHELQHAWPPCPSPTPGVHSNSHPSSWWCHPAISSSVVSFSSCPQSLPASGSFPMSQLFAWGGQSTGISALASVLPKNTQDWSPLEWTGWISLQSKGLSRVFSNTTVQKHQFFGTQLSSVQISHPYMTTGKTIALTRRTFVGKVMSLLLNRS